MATESGKPQTGAVGAYRLALTASNGITPHASQSLTLTGRASTQSVYLPFVERLAHVVRANSYSIAVGTIASRISLQLRPA